MTLIEQVRLRRHDVDIARAAGTVAVAPLYAIGWIVGKTWTLMGAVAAWTAAAVLVGWTAARTKAD